MNKITLGPFSFITNYEFLSDNDIRKEIEKKINKDKKLENINYQVNLLNITNSFKSGEYSYNFEIIAVGKIQKKVSNTKINKIKLKKMNDVKAKKRENAAEIMRNFMRRPLLEDKQVFENLRNNNVEPLPTSAPTSTAAEVSVAW